MKAVPYLEYCIWLRKEWDGGRMSAMDYTRLRMKAEEFYSQAFEPEMVLKFFEGWTKQEDYYTTEQEWLDKKKQIIMIWFNIGFDGYTIVSGAREYEMPFKFYRLDCFISDCQRALVKLNFNEETVKRIFT